MHSPIPLLPVLILRSAGVQRRLEGTARGFRCRARGGSRAVTGPKDCHEIVWDGQVGKRLHCPVARAPVTKLLPRVEVALDAERPVGGTDAPVGLSPVAA